MGVARVSVRRLAAERAPAASGSRADETLGLDGPLGVARVLDRAFELYVPRFGLLVGVVTLLVLPLHLVGEAWSVARPLELGLRSGLPSALDSPAVLFLPFLALVPWAASRTLVTMLVASALLGRPLGLGRALVLLLGHLPALVLLAGATSLALTAGLCACLVPAVPLAWLCERALFGFALASAELGEREPQGGGALARGLRAARTQRDEGPGFLRWVACTGASLLFVLPFFTQVQEAIGLREALRGALPGPLATLLLALVASVQQAVAFSFRSVVATVFHLDARVRAEGLDLALALRRVASGGAA